MSEAVLEDFMVEFSDGERLSLPNGGPTVSVFKAAQDAGIRLAHDCLGGTCGTCRGRVQAGRIAWLADTEALALSGKAADEGGDEVLACQAHAQPGAHIVFPYPRAAVLPQRKRKLRVTAKRRVGAAVWHVSCTSERALEFLPGQYLRVTPPGFEAPRAFSPCTEPGAPTVDFLIRELPQGAMSSYLREREVVGDVWNVAGPLGTFYRRHTDAPSLYLAGGTGLAPVLSMLREQQRLAMGVAAPQPKTLVFGVTRGADLFHVAELAQLARAMPGLAVRICAQDGDAGEGKNIVHGTVLDALESADVQRLGARGMAYMCGPPPMLHAVRERLAAWGLPAQRLFAEEFIAS